MSSRLASSSLIYLETLPQQNKTIKNPQQTNKEPKQTKQVELGVGYPTRNLYISRYNEVVRDKQPHPPKVHKIPGGGEQV